MEVKA